MVSTPSIPAPAPAPVAPTTEETQAETKEKTQKQILDAERNRQGRAETILTSNQGDGSMAKVARKTLLGE